MEHKDAIIIGATGLVGSQLVRQLLSDDRFRTVKIFGRRTTGIQHPKLQEYIVNFDQVEEWQHLVRGDVLFSTLGTTLKQAGSKEAQYKIDYTYQYEVAKAADQNGTKWYVLVSSGGASPRSGFFYTRMKGQLEEAVKDLDFDHIHILQPAILVGDRKEERKGENTGISVLRFLNRLGIARRYKPIDVSVVAEAMIKAAFRKEMIATYKFREVFDLAWYDPHELSLKRHDSG